MKEIKKMENKTYLVHGYLASINSHWFPWLKQELSNKNEVLEIIKLPEPSHPKFDQWNIAVAEGLIHFHKNNTLIAHSLGCISLLHYLSNYHGPAFSKLILIGGFTESLPLFPELDDFIEKCNLNFEHIKSKANDIVVFYSTNDPIVNPVFTKKLAELLNANLVAEENAGHFLDSDGYIEFKRIIDFL
ncbi:alpha/beta hydrolase [Acinetobacter baumannii]|uniref:RBBP9/YdeN family alpha/beta hydrolase n=1 Tax=Acinetobacter baumannii TaxID=470 RepID=UPI00233FEF98|nr:alpha/beta hydrolase [Acinetobacter baumannii]